MLGLACTQVGDTVVRRGLLRCPQLVKLNLSRTRITDNGEAASPIPSPPPPPHAPPLSPSPSGLKMLKRMPLAHVNLDGTGVSLAGIADLLTLGQISSVRASNTRAIPLDQVSDEEWETP